VSDHNHGRVGERVRGAADEPEATPRSAALEISNAIVRTHKECYGKGPTKARTHLHGDHVLCVLQGGFHASERTLLAHGRQEAVDAQRTALQQVVRQRFVSVVEQALGRRVRSSMSASDPHQGFQAQIFVLEPQPLEDDGGPPTDSLGTNGGPPTDSLGTNGGPPTGSRGANGGPPTGWLGADGRPATDSG
jgi:uncharacterized protein YbcI